MVSGALSPFVPSNVEGWAGNLALATGPSTSLGTNGIGADHTQSTCGGGEPAALSYTPHLCQRWAMLTLHSMLRKARQRLNIDNIRPAV